MSSRTRSIVIACVAACVALATFLVVRNVTKEVLLPPSVRLTTNDSGKQTLEVPIVRYRSAVDEGIAVDYISAVHLGEAAYYSDLNERFKTYDAVLFELIADPGAVMTLGVKGKDSALGSLQRTLAGLLGLEFQLDYVNYQAPNFVHADLTPEGLKAAMSARGESLAQMLLKVVKLSFDPEFQASLEEAGFKSSGLDDINPLMIAIRGPTESDRKKLRRFMAQGIAGSDKIMEVLSGEMGSSIITDRNRAALNVLKSELANGKRKIAIFYGAAHLPDMDENLTKEFKFERSDVEWLQAWDVQ